MPNESPLKVSIDVPSKKLFVKCLFFMGAIFLFVGVIGLLVSNMSDEKNAEILKNGTPAQAVIIKLYEVYEEEYDGIDDEYRSVKKYKMTYSFTNGNGETVRTATTVDKNLYDKYFFAVLNSSGDVTVNIHYNDKNEVVFDDQPQTSSEVRLIMWIFIGLSVVPICAGAALCIVWKPFAPSSVDKINKHYEFPSNKF